MQVINQMRKALVPVAVAAVLWALSKIGVIETPELVEQVTLVVTAVLVYLIPNKVE